MPDSSPSTPPANAHPPGSRPAPKSANYRPWCGAPVPAGERGPPPPPGPTPPPHKPPGPTVASLGRAAARLQRQADDVITATATLQADRELLASIPGVGAVTAQAILAELPEPARF